MYLFKTLDEISENDRQYYWDITLTYWEPVIIHSKVKDVYWERVKKYFPQYQWYLFDETGAFVGFGNTLPLHFSEPVQDLPDQGWDWMVRSAVTQYEDGIAPNCLGGLQIVVFKSFRQNGFSRMILEQIKSWFRDSDLGHFILPIRPILKEHHPDTAMEEYMYWEKDGKSYDPWIRLHVSQGGKMIKVCEQSMEVTGNRSDWLKWTGVELNGSGKYPVQGGLCEIDFDAKSDLGVYWEPNIWTVYEK